MVTTRYCQRHCSREHRSTYKGIIPGIVPPFKKEFGLIQDHVKLYLFLSPHFLSYALVVGLMQICESNAISFFWSSKSKCNFVPHCFWTMCMTNTKHLWTYGWTKQEGLWKCKDILLESIYCHDFTFFFIFSSPKRVVPNIILFVLLATTYYCHALSCQDMRVTSITCNFLFLDCVAD